MTDLQIIDGKEFKSPLYLRVEKNFGISEKTIKQFNIVIQKSNIRIYQLYHDDLSKQKCEKGFYPKMNTEIDRSKNPYQENYTIIDTYYNEKWQDFDFIGFVSWRFREKAKIGYDEIMNSFDPLIQAFSLSPKDWQSHGHMFGKKEVTGLNEICVFIDSKNILPVKLCNNKFAPTYCNFWILSKDNFKNYLENYLIPVINLFNKSDEGKRMLDFKYSHRGDKYASVVFFLEGLIGAFLSTIKFEYIPKR